MAEFTFEILKNFGVLSESGKGWRRELNLVSWNNMEPKYDLRDWSPDHQKMSKGISMKREELEKLAVILSGMSEQGEITYE